MNNAALVSWLQTDPQRSRIASLAASTPADNAWVLFAKELDARLYELPMPLSNEERKRLTVGG